jgi:hypothetical protein
MTKSKQSQDNYSVKDPVPVELETNKSKLAIRSGITNFKQCENYGRRRACNK